MANYYDDDYFGDHYSTNVDAENATEIQPTIDYVEAKINWKQKLSSRKFWALVVGFVSPLLLAFGVGENVVTQVAAIIASGGAVVAYLFAEGMVDANRTDTQANIIVGGGDGAGK